VRVVALDYGSARTGVAASDPSGTLARPVGVVERVRSKAGLQRLVEVIGAEQPEQIVVGLPLTLRGTRGAQARETERFVAELRAAVDVPIETFDERFTTSLANRSGGSAAAEDARAAAHLLSSWLEWQSARR
jgi:putative holliday junction resolvase